MEKDKYFSSFLYSIYERPNSFFSSKTQKMFDGKIDTVSITTFKKWTFVDDFRIETEGGKVLCLARQICCKKL